MLLLQIIGTLGAIAFLILFRSKKKPRPQNILQKVFIETDHGSESVEDFLRRTEEEERRAEVWKEPWYREHTDPLFGRPINIQRDHFFHRARLKTDAPKLLNQYKAPFEYSKDGYVTVSTDEFPLADQRYIFEWMVEHMNEISADITKLLLKEDWIGRGKAKCAFDPSRIYRIELKGSQPVIWSIGCNTDIGEGEAFICVVAGKDQNVESAELTY